MGPKKKKAPASNLRGFATASIPSKPAPPPPKEVVEETIEAPTVESNATTTSTPLDLTEQPQPQPDASATSKQVRTTAAVTLTTARLKAESDARANATKAAQVDADPSITWIRLDHDMEARVHSFVTKYAAELDSLIAARKSFMGTLVAPTQSQSEMLSKLAYCYFSLELIGFKQHEIENAMKSVPGGDLEDLLNWLCINLDPEELPQKYTDKVAFTEEPVSVVSVKASGDNSQSVRDTAANPSEIALETDIKAKILQSMEASNTDSDSSDLDDSRQELPLNTQHAVLQLRIEHLKSTLSNDYKAHSMAPPALLLSLMKQYSSQLKSLESVRGFQKRKSEVEYAKLLENGSNKAFGWDKEFCKVIQQLDKLKLDADRVKVEKEREAEVLDSLDGDHDNSIVNADPADSHTDELNVSDDDAVGFGDIFDESTQPDASNSTGSYSIEILSLDIPKSWTGKTPRVILQEYCAKLVKQKGALKIKYEKYGDSQLRKSRLPEGSVSFEPARNIYVDNVKSSEEYIATIALYKLAGSNLPLYRSLPPSYRDLWISMADAEKAEAEGVVQAEEARKLEFLNSLLEATNTGKKVNVPIVSGETADKSKPQEAKRGMNSSITLSDTIRTKFLARKSNPQYLKMADVRKQLPVNLMKDRILELVENHQVVIISGETGSGRGFTQIPQFLLEHAIEQGRGSEVNIVCTQPRRISATSIASRVSEELGDPSNFGTGALVGYSVRLDSKTSSTTRLTFQTIGVLLRQTESNPHLTGITHIVVDEVHERGLESDFLVLQLRRLLKVRPDLRVILMSATADALKFSTYFEEYWAVGLAGYTIDLGSEFARRIDYRKKNIGNVKVSGRGGNVANVSLEVDDSDDDDSYSHEASSGYSKTTQETLKKMDFTRIDLDLVEMLIRHIVSKNVDENAHNESVLVFLPGLAEIRKLYDRLSSESIRDNHRSKMLVLPLHSVLSASEQAAVFKPAPKGVRKVVLSTNIAETGVTIPDVVFVIDTCKAREVSYDQKRNISRLSDVFVSQANCRQRRGRAGRVKPGICYHLIPKDEFDLMLAHRPPEMLRLPLEELILRVLTATRDESESVDVRQLLSEALDPPPPKNIERAISLLKQIQALYPNGQLTLLGKMLLFACSLNCLDPLSLGKDPFALQFDDSIQVNPAKQFKSVDSDLITIWNAYSSWRSHILKNTQTGNGWNSAREYARNHGLNFTNFTMIEEARLQLQQALASSGMINIDFRTVVPRPLLTNSAGDVSKNMTNTSLAIAAISSGIYPSFLVYSPVYKPKQPLLHFPNSSDQVYINSKSLLSTADLMDGSWYASYSITTSGSSGNNTGRITARDLNAISPIIVLAVSGGLVVEHTSRMIKTDSEFVKLKCPPRTASLLAKFILAVQQALDMRREAPQSSFLLEALDLWITLIH
ncbi:P-loop containing nucleoside triphosphate hydrolase protein [Rhizoclosmatium globosum]|uniref:RNA helicase n=1 Tax=Rhizoclosmatium globosum TaxID=329046 RepID=A0A1Y2D1I1_9FUNG|nr:P-loop containing nucleoside triphosphate hydrolase protein [Rhizoclosmatium globosum]|eukprot:ORY52974.1 P-loop containing nucleoside triphosphate hydrolase protein [Rhizoclosmatium globosum]